MRSFIYKLLLFSLPIVVLLLPLDYFLSSLYRKAHSCEGELEVLNDIYNGKAKCNFAIYGSSRAFVHIDPKVSEGFFKCRLLTISVMTVIIFGYNTCGI
jgi:hypothetical protein